MKLISETGYKISQEAEESKRFKIISESFHEFGFGEDNRWRVGQIVDNGKTIVLRYGEGNYGTLNLTDIRYNVGTSPTGSVIDQEEPIFFKTQSMAFVVMPLVKEGKTIGVLSLDSPDLGAFSDEVVKGIDAYKFLITNALSQPADEGTYDPMSMITKFRKQQVIVLGKDTGEGLKRLLDVSEILVSLGYRPLLVKEQPDIPEMSNEEKVRVLADTSKFVVLENSFPAGQIAEIKMCATNRIITACLRERGKGSSWMVTDYSKDFDFISEFEYQGDKTSLAIATKSATEWAEAKVRERIAYYESTYPWRNKLERDQNVSNEA